MLVVAAGDGDTVDRPSPDGLEELLDRGLVWGDAGRVHLPAAVREIVGPYPAGLGRPAAILFRGATDLALVPVLRGLGLPPAAQPRAGTAVAEALADPARLAELIAGTDPDERAVLDRLAAGPPVGAVASTRADGAVARLAGRGLLVALDAQRVELPREVGLALRASAGAGAPSSAGTEPPELPLVSRAPAELDRLGSTVVLEFLRLVDALTDAWTAAPPAQLRAGGVGVRELRRTARELGVDESTAALVAEVAHAAGLVNSTHGPEPAYLPTGEYDVWRERATAPRWIALASSWLAMTRQPSLVNQRGDRDRVISVLGPDVERGTVPALRRQVLAVLAALPPGAAPASREDVLARLAWHQPRRASAQRPLVEAILAEADLLGLTAAGGLTGYSRTLLADDASPGTLHSSAAAEHALAAALPEPVDHFLVQPDLTVVVPGPPEPSLGAELALLADLESTGGAHVYRITERSVRRALDAGRTGAQLAEFVETRSRTPIPQALRYLIDDAARRHGRLRAGAASSYLRCDDAALLARVLAEKDAEWLHLRQIAPTVVVSDAPVNRLLEALRGAGYSPAAEAPGGELITLGVEPVRAPSRPAVRPIGTRAGVGSDAQLAEVVRRLRSGDALATATRSLPVQVPGVTSAATMELLRRAVREELLLWLGVAEPDGAAGAHEIHPISLAAGYVRGYERGRSGLVSYPVHRITAIRILDEDEP